MRNRPVFALSAATILLLCLTGTLSLTKQFDVDQGDGRADARRSTYDEPAKSAIVLSRATSIHPPNFIVSSREDFWNADNYGASSITLVNDAIAEMPEGFVAESVDRLRFIFSEEHTNVYLGMGDAFPALTSLEADGLPLAGAPANIVLGFSLQEFMCNGCSLDRSGLVVLQQQKSMRSFGFRHTSVTETQILLELLRSLELAELVYLRGTRVDKIPPSDWVNVLPNAYVLDLRESEPTEEQLRSLISFQNLHDVYLSPSDSVFGVVDVLREKSRLNIRIDPSKMSSVGA